MGRVCLYYQININYCVHVCFKHLSRSLSDYWSGVVNTTMEINISVILHFISWKFYQMVFKMVEVGLFETITESKKKSLLNWTVELVLAQQAGLGYMVLLPRPPWLQLSIPPSLCFYARTWFVYQFNLL
jgi:hypothetical protein